MFDRNPEGWKTTAKDQFSAVWTVNPARFPVLKKSWKATIKAENRLVDSFRKLSSPGW
jgi:hypothetical protein